MKWKEGARRIRHERELWKAEAFMWRRIATQKADALDEFFVRLMKLLTEIEKKAIGG